LFAATPSQDDLTSILDSVVMSDDLDTLIRNDESGDDDCYCIIAGLQLGPISFEALGHLAKEGRLTANDQVRLGGDGVWIRAGEIVGLVDAETQAAAGAQIAATETKLFDRDTDFNLRQIPQANEPARQSPEDEDEPKEWRVKIDGKAAGPFTFGAIFEMVRQGSLQATDSLKHGSGPWMPASSVVGLFPDHVDEEPEQEVAPARPAKKSSEKAASSKTTKKPVKRRQVEDEFAYLKERPAEETPRPTAPTPSPALERPTPQPATALAPAAAPNYPPAPAYVPPQPAAPRTFTPPPKAAFARGPKTRASLNIDFKLVGGGIAALLIVFGLWQFGVPSFGGKLDESMALWQETVLLHQPENDGAKWEEFKKQALPRAKELVAKLESSSDPNAQTLLKCYKEYLPAILEAGPSKITKEWKAMFESMKGLQS
jgi:hypothetical protein